MSINYQGSVVYKTKELMKLTKAQLAKRVIDLDNAVSKLSDALKFEFGMPAHIIETVDYMKGIIHN